jgi:hypothetical protein
LPLLPCAGRFWNGDGRPLGLSGAPHSSQYCEPSRFSVLHRSQVIIVDKKASHFSAKRIERANASYRMESDASLECGDLSPLWSRDELQGRLVTSYFRGGSKAATSRRTPGRRVNPGRGLLTKCGYETSRIWPQRQVALIMKQFGNFSRRSYFS